MTVAIVFGRVCYARTNGQGGVTLTVSFLLPVPLGITDQGYVVFVLCVPVSLHLY